MIAVLDTASVSALAPIDQRGRARLRALRARTDDLVLPAAVIAEGLLIGHPGRDYHTRRLLELVAVADVDRNLGLAAGALRSAAIASGPVHIPSGVDAIVAAVADSLAAGDPVQVITSDEEDLGLLLSFATHADRVSILRV